MARLLPLLWTAFGASVAYATILPKPGAGGFSAFCAFCFLFAACVFEIIEGNR